jgi:predicted nucleotidyltransferase
LRDDEPIALIKPLDELTERTIRRVYEAANALNLEVLLCGATARVLVLEHIFGCEPDRKTNDVDFAFAVNDWSQHDALVVQLTATGLWERDKPLHRLKPSSPSAGVYQLDLVPYGNIANEHGNISWPPKREFEMSMLGFAEANTFAMRVTVTHDVVISVVDPTSSAMLKLIAWHDRKLDPDHRRKHAQDFASILKNYGEYRVNEERVYTAMPSVFERADGDVRLVGAWLLGHDVRHRAAALTCDRLRSVFAMRNELLRDMLATRAFLSTEHADEFLSYFVDGFESSTF